MFEKGRFYSVRKDGTKDSLYLNIKNKRFLFGSAEYCTVRIYMDGIFPEHCVLTIGDQGKAYLEPLHPAALILVNGIKIRHEVCLEDNDLVTIFKKEFQFAYPPNILSRNVFFERLILLYSNQMKPTQNSTSGKSLINYMSHHVQESLEERRILSWKLYEFIIYLRRLLNKNEEYLCDLWPLLEFVWKYCIARASQDILFLPLKFLNLKGVITAHEKFQQFKITPCSPVSDTTSEKKNRYSGSSNCKIIGQKQEQYSSRKISISYKKRISLAVKRYHLRKRKSIMVAKAVEIGSVKNLELSGETPQVKDTCGESNSDEQKALVYVEKQQTTRTKKNRVYKKKEKENKLDEEERNGKWNDKMDLKIKQEISMEVVEDIGKQNTTSKEKRRNKKAPAKSNLKLLKENIPELRNNSSGNQVSISKRKQKPSKEKQNSKNQGKSMQEYDTQEISRCQRVTRSMTKSRC